MDIKQSCEIAGCCRSWTMIVRLGWRPRGVMSGSRKVRLIHLMGLGRPHLGCCTHFRVPHYPKDTDEPGKVCWGKPSFMINWLKETVDESWVKMNGLALKPQHGQPSNSLWIVAGKLSESREITYLAWSKGLICRQGNYENQIVGVNLSMLEQAVGGNGGHNMMLTAVSPLLGKV